MNNFLNNSLNNSLTNFSANPDQLFIPSQIISSQTLNTTSSQDGNLSQDSTLWHERGDVLAHLGQYREALDCFDRAITLQPEFVEAWVFRAVMLIYLEQYIDALDSCDRALELSPTHAEAWLFRGVVLNRLGYYPEAYACYDRALGKLPQPAKPSLWHRLRQSVTTFWRVQHSTHNP